MDRSVTLHRDSVDSVYSSDVGRGVLLQILEVIFAELSEKEGFFGESHGLDYKRLVVREKEETSTRATGLTCLENLLAVVYRAKRMLNPVPFNTVLSSEF